MKWKKTDEKFEKIAKKHLYNATVQVIQYVEEQIVSDDLFRTPRHLSSGVYNVPCYLDYSLRHREMMLPGGVSVETEAFLETNKKWYDTFNKNLSYVKHDGKEYEGNGKKTRSFFRNWFTV